MRQSCNAFSLRILLCTRSGEYTAQELGSIWNVLEIRMGGRIEDTQYKIPIAAIPTGSAIRGWRFL